MTAQWRSAPAMRKCVSLIVLPHTRLQRQSILLISTFGFSFLEYDLIHHNIPFALSPGVVCQRGPQLLKIYFWEIFNSFYCYLEAINKNIIQSCFFFTSSVLGCFFKCQLP